MRPDPTQPDRDQSGRIIYLGDVRRRRQRGREASDRQYLVALTAAALAGWALWLAVVLTVHPARLLTYLAFFLPLSFALVCTVAILAYAADWRMRLLSSLGRCIRRGVLVAAVIEVNLAIVAAHRWTFALAAISVAIALGIDFAISRRRLYG